MRAPRLIAIVLSWLGIITAVYLGYATKLPRGVIFMMFLGALLPYVLWLRIEPYFQHRAAADSRAGATLVEADGEPPQCARCGRPIVVDPELSRGALEGMHWLCFHLEFEHDGDADLRCADMGCPHWIREVYEAKLRELGADPGEVLDAAIRERYG